MPSICGVTLVSTAPFRIDQAMALSVSLGGNLTANATATISAALLQQAGSNGFHPTCGLASCRHILQGLTIANASAALAMASLETAPSWGFMVSPESESDALAC